MSASPPPASDRWWWSAAPRLRDVLVVLLSLAGAVVWFPLFVAGWPALDPGSVGVPLDVDDVRFRHVLAALTVLATVVALWWRRRHPVALTLLSLAVAVVWAYDTALWLALLTLAVRRRDRLLVLLGVAGALASVSAALRGATTGSTTAAALFALLGTGLCVSVGAFVGARRDLVASWRERAERAESEYALRAEQARLAERTRIAREMHDVLAHRISLVALHAGGLEVRPDVGPEQVEATAATIRETARTALEDLRRVLGVLRTPGTTGTTELAPQPTLVDVRRLVESTREAGVAARFRTDVPVHAQVPPELGRTVYRVVQEALTNVHKHAPSAPTVVTVSGEVGGELVVAVVNERPTGPGSALPGAGSGLVGLAERVGLADGTITSGPEPDGGFAVRARLPWPSPDGARRGTAAARASWTPPDARIMATRAGGAASPRHDGRSEA
ncbi:sensor histidine kinase [Kineococcus sp. SYSU DK004]|uniref:sensor histidine kinase n=1 Tax=Kineococcus sp. SYSU DK004 TaxID=3383125 RepID=UPI003D7CDFFF